MILHRLVSGRLAGRPNADCRVPNWYLESFVHAHVYHAKAIYYHREWSHLQIVFFTVIFIDISLGSLLYNRSLVRISLVDVSLAARVCGGSPRSHADAHARPRNLTCLDLCQTWTHCGAIGLFYGNVFQGFLLISTSP